MTGRFSLPVRWKSAKDSLEPERIAVSEPELPVPPPVEVPSVDQPLINAKVKLHGKIIDEFNLLALEKLNRSELFEQVSGYVSTYVRNERIPLNQPELEQFTDEVIDEMIGLGPLEPLLKDVTISDILINSHEHVFVERFGQIEHTAVRFKDEPHLLRIINKIVTGVGRRVDESSPMMDARLLDGSRVNVAIRPVAIDGPLVSIRKFSKRPFSMERLIEVHALPREVADLLRAAVGGKISMIVSGGTGSGKTTLLNALSGYISSKERLITIEDSAELQIQQGHVARLETRPPNAEGRGEIRQRELVKNALRMRPDRIIIGECRGEEAFDMLQAMNTGHEGSMTTIHANNPRDAVRRMEQMVGMAGLGMSQQSIRQQISSAIQVVIQLQRLSDGSRRVVSVTEVTGMENDVIQMQEIFNFKKGGLDAEGRQLGSFKATGVRPSFLNLKQMGFEVPASTFDPTEIFERSMNETTVFYALVFAATVLLIGSLYSYFAGSFTTKQRIDRRIERLQQGENAVEVLQSLRRERWLGGDQQGINLSRLQTFLVQSGVRQDGQQLALTILILLGVFATLFYFVLGLTPLSVVATITTTIALIFLYFYRERQKRIDKFKEQFPDILDLLVRSLRAGHPLPVSFSLAAREMADPAGTELGIVADEVQFGSTIASAVSNMSYRVGDPDLEYLVTAITIQVQTGGNLGEVLQRLAKLMRERFRLSRKVRALTSEARFSAIALSLFPIGLFFLIYLISPNYYGEVWGLPSFKQMLIVSGALLLVGNLVMRKLANIKY